MRKSSTRRRWVVAGHVRADDLAGGGEGQVGDLGAQVGHGAELLGLDLGGRPLAQALELGLGRGDVGVAALLGDLLGTLEELARLAARLGQGLGALLLRVRPVRPGLLRVAQPLLDPRPALDGASGSTGRAEQPVREDEEQDERCTDVTMTQKRLIWKPALGTGLLGERSERTGARCGPTMRASRFTVGSLLTPAT